MSQAPDPQREHVARLLSGSAFSATGMAISGVLTLATGIALARWLGPQGFGVYSVALVAVTFLGGLGTLGMDNAVARFVAFYEGGAARHQVRSVIRYGVTRAAAASILIAGLLLILLHGTFAELGKVTALRAVSFYVALAVPAVALQFVLLQAILGLQQLRSRIVLERIAHPALRLALPFALIWLIGDAVRAAVAGLLAGAAMIVVAAALVLRKRLESFPRAGAPASPSDQQAWRGYSTPFVLYSLQNFVSQGMGIDVLLVSVLASVRESGIYAAAFRFAPALVLARSALDYAFGPKVAFLWGQRDHQSIADLYRVSSGVALAWTMPMAVVLVLFARPILSAFFGPGYAEGALALAVLTVGFVADGATGCNTSLLAMIGRPWLVLINGLAGGVLTVAICWLAVPRYGIVGAALAVSLARVATNGLATAEIWREQGWQPFSRTTLKVAGATLFALALGLILRHAFVAGTEVSAYRLLAPIALMVASYALVLRVSGLSWVPR